MDDRELRAELDRIKRAIRELIAMLEPGKPAVTQAALEAVCSRMDRRPL